MVHKYKRHDHGEFKENEISELTRLFKQVITIQSNIVVNSENQNPKKGDTQSPCVSLIATIFPNFYLDHSTNRHMTRKISLLHNYIVITSLKLK